MAGVSAHAGRPRSAGRLACWHTGGGVTWLARACEQAVLVSDGRACGAPAFAHPGGQALAGGAADDARGHGAGAHAVQVQHVRWVQSRAGVCMWVGDGGSAHAAQGVSVRVHLVVRGCVRFRWGRGVRGLWRGRAPKPALEGLPACHHFLATAHPSPSPPSPLLPTPPTPPTYLPLPPPSLTPPRPSPALRLPRAAPGLQAQPHRRVREHLQPHALPRGRVVDAGAGHGPAEHAAGAVPAPRQPAGVHHAPGGGGERHVPSHARAWVRGCTCPA